jgi:lauroyl/myristoyl acyltransferase
VSAVRRVADAGVAAAIAAIGLPLALLPWPLARRLGRIYGAVLWACWPEGRRVGLINLRRAYGPAIDRSAAGRRVRRCCAGLGEGIAEAVQIGLRRTSDRERRGEIHAVEDAAVEARVLAHHGPRIFVTGHLGSWEGLLMLASLRLGSRGAAVARGVDNPYVDALLRRVRRDIGATVIEKRGGLQDAMAVLARGDDLALLLDENGGPRGPFVPVFGRLASTRKTAALLSSRTGAPIVLGAAVRRAGAPSLLVRLRWFDPVESEATPARLREVTQQLSSAYEAWIRDDPDQWRWVHWRWKSRPDGRQETYTRADVRAAFATGSDVVGGEAHHV